MAAVDVQNVRKVYKRDAQDIVVLYGLSLQVPEGGLCGMPVVKGNPA